MSVEFYRMKDASSSYRVPKGRMFDLPMRLLVVGKSMLSGKSNYVMNLLTRPFDSKDVSGKDMYRNDFQPECIHIFCPSADLDQKMATYVEDMHIPDSNVHREFTEEDLNDLYEELEAQFMEEQDEGNVRQKLIIFDDCSFSGALKNARNGAIARIFMNGRHIALSCIVTAQKYSDILTSARENCTGCVLFECSRKQQELISEDHCCGDKRKFLHVFNECTRQPHEAFVINYTNPREERFLNHHYEPVQMD